VSGACMACGVMRTGALQWLVVLCFRGAAGFFLNEGAEFRRLPFFRPGRPGGIFGRQPKMSQVVEGVAAWIDEPHAPRILFPI